MRIAVFGAGGIGGYFGARLAQAGDEVTLIARGPHLRAIQEHGLFVESPSGDFHMAPSIATDRPEDIGIVDVVLLGVKAWDVRAAAAAIRPMVGATTGVLTLQNGVEAPTEVAEVLGDSHVMVGVTPVRSVIAAPGRLRHVGGVDPNLTLGEIDNQSSARVEHIRTALAKVNVTVNVAENIQAWLWGKFVGAAAIGGVGAVVHVPIGVWRQIPQVRDMIERVMQEAMALAPVVAQWRDAGEQERHVPRPLFEVLRDAGIFSMSAPTAVGGAEVEEETVLQVIEELARQDGSVGWNVMIASNTAIIASYLPAAALREVYRGGPNTVIAGALPPTGAAMPVPGGFRLTGAGRLRAAVIKRTGCTGPAPSWHRGRRASARTAGRTSAPSSCPLGCARSSIPGTQPACAVPDSHDWQVTDIFVPEERSFPILFDGPSAPGCLSLSDFAPYAAPRIAAVALGMAREAIDAFTALARTKTPHLATSPLATQHTTHERVGRAEALLRAGRAFLCETVRALPYGPSWSEALSDALRASSDWPAPTRPRTRQRP